MLYLLFGNQKIPIRAEVTIMGDGVIRVKAQEQVEEVFGGFKLYADRQMRHMIGDYSAYKTQYRDEDAFGMYWSTGKVYVKPSESEPVYKPTTEDITEAERLNKVSKLQIQIDNLKAEIEATDYRIIKAYEYSMVGMESGYDMESLHMERQSLRDAINGLEEEIQKINRKGDIQNE